MGLVERGMLGGILLVVGLWLFGSRFTDATGAAILGVVLLVARGIVTWDDVAGNRQAWSVFVWFATLVTLAGGLAEVGVIRWVADLIESPVSRVAVPWAVPVLIAVFFYLHYFFATVSGHTAALLPIFLLIATGPLDVSPRAAALGLGFTLRIFLGCYLLIGLPWLISRA